MKIILPFGIWCFLFQPILWGNAVISSETLHIYSVVKFYIDNLKLGVFPLWEPFVLWGEPTQIFFNYAGIFNPLWLLTALVNICGLSFYTAFLFSITAYFWLGVFGFYLLAKIVLRNSRAAYVAFLLFLFSSLSMSMFAQFHTPLIYVPSIWFFYFLISFFEKPTKKSVAGLTLTSAIILTSYLPFYFLTVFLIVMTLLCVFYSSRIRPTLLLVSSFVRTHLALVVLSLGVIVLSFLPGYLAYEGTVNKDVVAPFRGGDLEKKSGFNFVDYDKVSRNGFSSRMDLSDLYSDLDMIQYGDDCFFYVSLFFYIVLIFGALIRVNKVVAICGLTALPLFFLMMASATGFHRYVFEHVFYFRLIRNMHFFMPFFVGALVLLVAEQLRVFEEKFCSEKSPRRSLIVIVLIHIGLAIFLAQQEAVIFTSYVGLGLSLLFWTVFILAAQNKKASIFLSVLLFLAILVQPLEVIWRHNQKGLSAASYSNKALIEQCVRSPGARPVFSYTRPISDRDIGNDDTAYSRINMKDASRFFKIGFPPAWTYELTLREPFEVLQQYTKYKFHVYDQSAVLRGEGDFKTDSAVTGPSNLLRVTAFNVNSIRIQTNYPGAKTLVYTDSFHKYWKAFVNGQSVAVDRVNGAFKGIRIPPGSNEVVLTYSPPKVALISLALIGALFLVLLFLVWFWFREQ